jgi:hypothetical protein
MANKRSPKKRRPAPKTILLLLMKVNPPHVGYLVRDLQYPSTALLAVIR